MIMSANNDWQEAKQLAEVVFRPKYQDDKTSCVASSLINLGSSHRTFALIRSTLGPKSMWSKATTETRNPLFI